MKQDNICPTCGQCQPSSDKVLVPKEHLNDALNYIKHCGANAVMRGQPHPQQQIVDWLEAALTAAEAEGHHE